MDGGKAFFFLYPEPDFYLSYYDYTINTATISEDGLTLSVHFTNEYDSYPIIQTFMR